MNDEPNPLARFLEFLQRLDEVSIAYDLKASRADALMAFVVVPGERWEVEFFADGQVEIEVFRSGGDILDVFALDDLFERFSD